MDDIKFTAPLMDNIRWNNKHYDFDLTILTKESKEELSKLVEKLSRIKPKKSFSCQYKWDFWIDVPKGELSDYGDYKELKAEGIYKSRKKFIEDWKRDYPESVYWHEITVVTEKTYTGLWLDDAALIRQDLGVEKENSWPNADYCELLVFLTTKVDEIVDMLVKGEYNDYIRKTLPYKYRTGLIKRKKLWEIDKTNRDYDISDLSEKEISDYCKYAEIDAENNNKPEKTIKRMSSGKYYEICSYCYIAAKFDRIDGLTPKKMFEVHGDDRDGGMSTLDENDEDAFDSWYDLPDQEKWEIQNPSHMWEIREGHTHTSIHLYLNKDSEKGGYYFTLSGGTHCQTPEVVRMYVELKQRSIPVTLYKSDMIAKKITGEDYVGIIPITETGWSYWYGGFRDKNVLNFDSLNEIKNADDVIQFTDWYDVNTLSLIEGNANEQTC